MMICALIDKAPPLMHDARAGQLRHGRQTRGAKILFVIEASIRKDYAHYICKYTRCF